MTNAQGLDVSRWNGAFDWRGHPSIAFAAAKASEHTAADPDFAANWADMKTTFDNKIVRIAYCYAHPGDAMAPQADYLVQLVKDHGLQPGDHFALDMEAGQGQATPDNVAVPEVRAWARAFSRRVNVAAPEHRCFGYCSADAGWGWGLWPAWTADWGVSSPRVASPWTRWWIWQKSADGTDLDEFAGDRGKLLDFCRMPGDRR